eukprot:scaffold3342_cov150-Skeletonema_menzelii.AAC.1
MSSELQAVLEARRRRTDALANLISNDDHDDDDDFLLGGEQPAAAITNDTPTAATTNNEKQPADIIAALLNDNDDDEVSMPATPPSFVRQQQQLLKNSGTKTSNVGKLTSPSSLANEQHYRPFMERKLKLTNAAATNIVGGGRNINNEHQSKPVRTYSSPPGRLSSDEPSDEEADGTTTTNTSSTIKKNIDGQTAPPVSPRQRYLQTKKQQNIYQPTPPSPMGGNSSIASSSNNSHAESELQMRLRDRFQRTANSQSTATTAEDSNGNDDKVGVAVPTQQQSSSQGVSMQKQVQSSSSFLPSRQHHHQQQQQQHQLRPPSPSLPSHQQSTATVNTGSTAASSSTNTGGATRAGRTSTRFFTRTSPPLRTTSSSATTNSGGSLNSYGSNTNIAGGSGRSGSGGSMNDGKDDGNVGGKGSKQSQSSFFVPISNETVRVGEEVVDWPSSSDDNAVGATANTTLPQSTLSTAAPSSTIPTTTTSAAAATGVSPPRQIGGRNTTGGYSRTVAGRAASTSVKSSTSTATGNNRGGGSSNNGKGGGSPNYRGKSNPQMLSFMAKKYKESKSGSPRGAERSGGGSEGGSPVKMSVETTGGGGGVKEEKVEKTRTPVEKNTMPIEKKTMPVVPSSPKSDVPEFMGVKLRKTNRAASGGGAGGGSGVSISSDSGKKLEDSPQPLTKQSVSSSSVEEADVVTQQTVTASAEESTPTNVNRNNVQRRWQPQQQQQQHQVPQSKGPSRVSGGGNVLSRYTPAGSTPKNTDSNSGNNNAPRVNNSVGKITNSRFHVAAAAALANDQSSDNVQKEEESATAAAAVEDSFNEEEIINDFANFDLMDKQNHQHEETEKAEVLESPPKQKGKYMFNNYDTAVMAAKEAITASNLNRMKDFAEQEEPSPLDPISPTDDDDKKLPSTPVRQQPWHKKNAQQRSEEAYGESILDDRADDDEDNDPSLRMEQSPSDDMMMNKKGYPFLDSLVLHEEELAGADNEQLDMVYSTDPSEEVDHHYMSPTSTTEEEVPAKSNRQSVDSFFGTSFLVANEDGNKEEGDADAADNLFDSDPFDPFNTGAFSNPSPSKNDQDIGHAASYDSSSVEEEQPPATPVFEANFDDIRSNNEIDEHISDEIKPRMSSESMLGYSLSRSATDTSYELSPRASNDTMGEFKADAGDLIEDATYEDEVVHGRPPMQQTTILYDNVQHQGQSAVDQDVPGSFIMQPLHLDVAGDGKRVPGPKSNPLSGNLIVCKANGRGDFLIQEVDVSRNKPVTVLSAKLLTNELKMRLARSSAVSKDIKIVGVTSVLSLSAGVHRVQGRARVRVAALAEVLVVGNSRNGTMNKMRLVAVWKWGYNPGGVSLASLQSVLTTQTIDGTSNEYDPATLQVADGLLFLGGRNLSSGPVVFIAKPAVRDSWTSVPITNSTAETVSALATTNDAIPYVAVGFNDGRVSIWSYDLAVRTNRISAEQATSLLRLLYHIRGELDVSDLSDSDCLWPHERFFSTASSPPMRSQSYVSATVDEPQCTSLSWIKPSSSGISTLPLLAASFSSGIAIYNVTSADQNSSAPSIIPPLAQTKFLTHQEQSEIDEVSAKTFIKFRKPKVTLTWYDLGPRSPPCVAMIFEHEKVSFDSDNITVLDRNPVHRLCLCAIDIPWYGSVDIADPEKTQEHRAIGVLCQNDVNATAAMTILDSPSTGSIMCYTGGNVLTCKPTLTSPTSSRVKVDGFFSSLSCPVSSSSLGLDSTGAVYFGNVNTAVKSKYRDTVLTVFPLTSWNGHGENAIPSQRYWMLMSNSGDSKMDVLPYDQRTEVSPDGGDEVIKTGAVTDILCELTCGENPVSGLVPGRVLTEQGGLRVAVLYSTGFFGGNPGFSGDGSERCRTQTRLPHSPVAYAIIDLDDAMKQRGSTPFTLRHGRDVAFLPPARTNDGFYCSSVIVLHPTGTSLSMTTVISSDTLSEKENEVIVESIGKCSLQYEGIEGHRVFALLNCNSPEVLVAGYSELVGLPCLVCCTHSIEKDSNSKQLTLVEGTDQGHRLWLKPGEEVMALVELPRQNQSARGNVAVATQQRVMILSMVGSISIIAEVEAFLTCTSLSPIGSHCVAFSASTGSCGGGTTRIMYLSCLQSIGHHGIISTLPSGRHGKTNSLLSAIRPDRFIFSNSQGGIRHASDHEDDSSFTVPLSQTRPIFLLEPLIANALCQDKLSGQNASKSGDAQILLRTIIEKFGRKESSFPHSDSEGIGSTGAGVTMKVYDMLLHYGCKQAASLLLTGNLPGDITSQPTILSPWIPMSCKLSAVEGADTALQVLSSGDNKLAEYLRNSDREPPSLPKPNDPSSILAKDLALNAVSDGNMCDAAKLLDFSGHQSSDGVLLQLPMARSSNVEPILQRILAESKSSAQAVKSYAEVLPSIGLGINDAALMSQLAPSVQKTQKRGRSRTGVIDASLIEASFPANSANENIDPAWREAINESKHVWSVGPFGKKEELLQLDSFVDWLGRCRPTVLGKEGVAMAADTGERALANILLAAAQEDVDQGQGDNESEDASIDGNKKNWVDGVGEGRSDEDNLSLYMRFSEGADEDCNWQADGFADLSKHKHQARLYGSELASLEATTSSVDEGEEGKVQLLYDLVYNDGAPRERATGVAIEVSRGGHLDVGMLHSSDDKARQRCTLEMWYHLPQAHLMTDEIILMRRSLFYEENSDVSKLCLPDERHNTLWELAVLPTGLLELRTGAGSVVTSAMFIKDNDDGLDGLVSWEREDGGGGWNHVCVMFSSMEQDSPSKVSASVLMNGVSVVPNALLSVDPFGATSEDVHQDDIDDALEKSILIFGIGPSVGFRLTDVRVWACQRSEDDVQMMMYEYLKDAEMKRKFKVNIRKSSAGMLAPPARLAQPERKKFALSPPKASQSNRTPPRSTPNDDGFGSDEVNFEPTFAAFNEIEPVQNKPSELSSDEVVKHEEAKVFEVPKDYTAHESEIDSPFEVVISDLLSTKVKSSAAAAIIRGPPAARHFGGNRGGLASVHTNFGLKPDGVGPIAISGPDKSLVFFSDRDPPGRTYPIGASGAVLSDIMDEKYSEYMCCFLAREKRMIIFELTRKTVVVELQMKTKLNFWRYLPPEAHGGELAFVLITPIGGFHWKPLENPPRPRQVWKRSAELESKKVITYEEGGSNGQSGADARSTVALLLVSSPVSSDANVEAYCISVDGESSRLLLSDDIQGAALCRPPTLDAQPAYFLPFVVTVQSNYETSQLVLTVEDLAQDNPHGKSLARGVTLASAILDLTDVSTGSFEPPPMSMGLSPEVLLCCNQGFVVAVIRSRGLIFAYDLTTNFDESGEQSMRSGNLSLVGKHQLGRYVVDAAIRPDGDNKVELVALLRESNDSKDGRIATIIVTREDNTC